MGILTSLKGMVSSWAESVRTAVSGPRTVKGIGEKVLFSHAHGMYGPGMWSQQRWEQVLQVKGWNGIAIKVIAEEVAGMPPQVAYLRTAEKIEEKRLKCKSLGGDAARAAWKGYRAKLVHRSLRAKALTTLQAHEDLELVDSDHDLLRLLKNPNKPDTSWTFLYRIMQNLEATGNAYIWVVPDRLGRPCELWVLPSYWVTPRPGKDSLVEWYDVYPHGLSMGGSLIRFPEDEIIHIAYPHPFDVLDGYSPEQMIAAWIDVAGSIDSSRWHQFRNKAAPSVLVEMDKDVQNPDKPTLDRFKAEFKAAYAGEGNTGEPMALGPGMKAREFKTSPTEMDYTASFDQMRDAILAGRRVSKSMTGIVEDTNRSAGEQARTNFTIYVIKPKLTLLGQVLTEKLARRFDKDLVIYWPDLTPDNREQTLAEMSAAQQGGGVTPNDWRRFMGLEAYRRGGNDPLIPSGLSPMPLQTGKDAEKQPIPALPELWMREKEEQKEEMKKQAGAAGQGANGTLQTPGGLNGTHRNGSVHGQAPGANRLPSSWPPRPSAMAKAASDVSSKGLDADGNEHGSDGRFTSAGPKKRDIHKPRQSSEEDRERKPGKRKKPKKPDDSTQGTRIEGALRRSRDEKEKEQKEKKGRMIVVALLDGKFPRRLASEGLWKQVVATTSSMSPASYPILLETLGVNGSEDLPGLSEELGRMLKHAPYLRPGVRRALSTLLGIVRNRGDATSLTLTTKKEEYGDAQVPSSWPRKDPASASNKEEGEEDADEDAPEDQNERMQLMADILGGAYGDEALSMIEYMEQDDQAKAWNPQDHPRGKDGRFIEKNSPEAYAAAKTQVSDALRGKRTPEGFNKLSQILGIMSVKQLHQLKKEMQISASGKNKGELIAKLSDRMNRGRRTEDPSQDGQQGGEEKPVEAVKPVEEVKPIEEKPVEKKEEKKPREKKKPGSSEKPTPKYATEADHAYLQERMKSYSRTGKGKIKKVLAFEGEIEKIRQEMATMRAQAEEVKKEALALHKENLRGGLVDEVLSGKVRALDNKYMDMIKEIYSKSQQVGQISRDRAKLAHAALVVKPKSAIKWNVRHHTEKRFKPHAHAIDMMNQAMEFTQKTVAGGVLAGLGNQVEVTLAAVPARNQQRNFHVGGTVYISKKSDVGGVVHELGHHLEKKNRNIKRAALAFLESRVGNEKPQKMAKLFPGYGYDPTEVGRKDDFDKAFNQTPTAPYYAGKDYGGKATEIIAMGMELMYEDPVHFAKADPEYFQLIAAVMDGHIR